MFHQSRNAGLGSAAQSLLPSVILPLSFENHHSWGRDSATGYYTDEDISQYEQKNAHLNM